MLSWNTCSPFHPWLTHPHWNWLNAGTEKGSCKLSSRKHNQSYHDTSSLSKTNSISPHMSKVSWSLAFGPEESRDRRIAAGIPGQVASVKWAARKETSPNSWGKPRRGGCRKARTAEPYGNGGDVGQKRANSDHSLPHSSRPEDEPESTGLEPDLHPTRTDLHWFHTENGAAPFDTTWKSDSPLSDALVMNLL